MSLQNLKEQLLIAPNDDNILNVDMSTVETLPVSIEPIMADPINVSGSEMIDLEGMVLDGEKLSGAGSATTRRYTKEINQDNWRKVQISTVESTVDLAPFDITANSFKTKIPHVRGDIVIIDGVDTFIDSVSDDGAGVYTCVVATLDIKPLSLDVTQRGTPVQMEVDPSATIEIEFTLHKYENCCLLDYSRQTLFYPAVTIWGGTGGCVCRQGKPHYRFGQLPLNERIKVVIRQDNNDILSLTVNGVTQTFDPYGIASGSYAGVVWVGSDRNIQAFATDDIVTIHSIVFPDDGIIGIAKSTMQLSDDNGKEAGTIEVEIDGVMTTMPADVYTDPLKIEGIEIVGSNIKKTYEAQIVDTESLRFKYETTSVNDLVELNADLYISDTPSDGSTLKTKTIKFNTGIVDLGSFNGPREIQAQLSTNGNELVLDRATNVETPDSYIVNTDVDGVVQSITLNTKLTKGFIRINGIRLMISNDCDSFTITNISLFDIDGSISVTHFPTPILACTSNKDFCNTQGINVTKLPYNTLLEPISIDIYNDKIVNYGYLFNFDGRFCEFINCSSAKTNTIKIRYQEEDGPKRSLSNINAIAFNEYKGN